MNHLLRMCKIPGGGEEGEGEEGEGAMLGPRKSQGALSPVYPHPNILLDVFQVIVTKCQHCGQQTLSSMEIHMLYTIKARFYLGKLDDEEGRNLF